MDISITPTSAIVAKVRETFPTAKFVPTEYFDLEDEEMTFEENENVTLQIGEGYVWVNEWRPDYGESGASEEHYSGSSVTDFSS